MHEDTEGNHDYCDATGLKQPVRCRRGEGTTYEGFQRCAAAADARRAVWLAIHGRFPRAAAGW